MKRTFLADKVTLPNCITSVRILGSIIMIFTAPLSLAFFLIYSLCGLSDALDGWVARRTNRITDFGSKLDSIADLIFYVIMVAKILRILWKLVPAWFWYVLGAILVVRVVSYTTAALKFHRFASLHTRMNKISGLLVFATPYFLTLPFADVYCCFTVLFGAAATLEEFLLHLTRSEYHENHKALF